MRRLISALLLGAVLALPAAVPSWAADKIKVGFLSTLSGPGGALGVDMRDAFLLAVKLNGGKPGRLPAPGSGVGHPQKPEGAPRAAPRLTQRAHVHPPSPPVFSTLPPPLLPPTP